LGFYRYGWSRKERGFGEREKGREFTRWFTSGVSWVERKFVKKAVCTFEA